MIVEMYEGIIENKERRTLAAMVTAMDDTVKVVVDKLKSSEMWNDTLLIFMSDNGGPQLGLGIGQVNYPLRGGKLSLWEGGVRSSSFVHSPLIPGGRVLRELLHVTDWLPTLTHIGACGVEPDPECSGPSLGDIDGVNQWSAIIGASPSNRTEFLVNIDQKANNAALRWGPWKLYQGNPGKGPWVPPPQMDPERFNLQLISERKDRTNYTSDFDYVYSDGKSSKIMLYNVVEDPSEFYEVSAQHPDLVKTILERLQYYQNRAVPPRNKPHDPKSDPTNFGGAWTPWLDSC